MLLMVIHVQDTLYGNSQMTNGKPVTPISKIAGKTLPMRPVFAWVKYC